MSITFSEIKKFFADNNIPGDTEVVFRGDVSDYMNYYSRISKIYIEKFYKVKLEQEESEEEISYRSISDHEDGDVETVYDFSDFKIKVILECDGDVVYDYRELDVPKMGDKLNYEDYKICVLDFLLKIGPGDGSKGVSPIYILDQIGGDFVNLRKSLRELKDENKIYNTQFRGKPFYIATAYLKLEK